MMMVAPMKKITRASTKVKRHDEQERDEQGAAEARIVLECLDLPVILRGSRGHEEDDDDLRRLGGLEPHGSESHPAHHAAYIIAKAGNSRQHHQDAREHEQGGRHARERPHVVAPHENRDDEANRDSRKVTHEVCLGDGYRGGPDGDDPDDHQQKRGNELGKI